MKLYNLKNKLLPLFISPVLIINSCKNKEDQPTKDNNADDTSLSAVAGQLKKRFSLPYYSEAFFTPHWYSSDAPELASFHKIPAFELTNQRGASVTSESLRGNIYIVNFFFTSCPGICPALIRSMQTVEAAYPQDPNLSLLSFSVTPDKDDVETLSKYATKMEITSPNWHLLTGNRQDIYNLGRNGYFIEEDLGIKKTDDEFLHTENLVLIDENQHIRGIYNGINKTSVNQLIKDIKVLKRKASKEIE